MGHTRPPSLPVPPDRPKVATVGSLLATPLSRPSSEGVWRRSIDEGQGETCGTSWRIDIWGPRLAKLCRKLSFDFFLHTISPIGSSTRSIPGREPHLRIVGCE